MRTRTKKGGLSRGASLNGDKFKGENKTKQTRFEARESMLKAQGRQKRGRFSS